MIWYLLIANLLFCCLIVISGVLNVIKANDQLDQKLFGCVSVATALLIGVQIVTQLTQWNAGCFVPPGVLPPENIMVWFASSQLLSLLPLVSIRPLWLTPERMFRLAIPFGLSAFLFVLLHFAGIKIIYLATIQDFADNFFRPDVLVRFVVFLMSLFYPLGCLLIPFVWEVRKNRRRFSRKLYLYIGVGIFLCIMYIGFVFRISPMGVVIGLVSLPFYAIGSIVYLKNRDILSHPNTQTADLVINEARKIADSDRYIESISREKIEAEEEDLMLKYAHYIERVSNIMNTQRLFTDPKLTLNGLAREVGVNRNRLSEIIHLLGFSGFYEYIGHLRLTYFKELAARSPEMTITELHHRAGFNSRATFYRLFQQIESMTPTEYIANLQRNQL